MKPRAWQSHTSYLNGKGRLKSADVFQTAFISSTPAGDSYRTKRLSE
ncbi:hypothetical protein [Kingella potus]|nr:hypothetical protein [Kingella potus]UOP00722.1 hypothetical protein LVJ84_13180 [Kingella potus]